MSIRFLILPALVLSLFTPAWAIGAFSNSRNNNHQPPSSKHTNLIPNPGFSVPVKPIKPNGQATSAFSQAPTDWFIGAGGMLHDSRFWLLSQDSKAKTAIGITGGQDRQGKWNTILPACIPGTKYRFQAEFYRRDLANSDAYPEISIWGQSFRLNTLRMVGRFQPLHVDIICPLARSAPNRLFSFANMYTGVTFWMRNPRLTKLKAESVRKLVPLKTDYYPIGVFGATAKNLKEIKKDGLNSAIIGLDKGNIAACLEYNIHCTFGVSHDPEILRLELNRFAPLLKQGNFSFYVNDEPGIHSFPAQKAAAIQRIIKSRFPKSFTTMAIVRPQVIADYRNGADYFMLDQYPVPHMPMIWLSESMDEAAEVVGPNRLQSVIQAFGGQGSARDGWPRLPTFAEMNCLAFLSIIHGSRGVYFFSYPDISSSLAGREDLKHVVRRLNNLQSWLHLTNEKKSPQVAMVSRYGFDPAGHAAVQCAWKRQKETRMLLCVNTIRTSVEAEINSPSANTTWRDYYSYKEYYSVGGKIHIRFLPLEVQVLLQEN